MSKSNHFATRKKTITRTFRIRQEWDSVLQEEAARHGVSVNVLLNKILRKYSLYSRWNDRNNDISLPQRTLKEILSTVQVESLAEAGTRSGALDAVNIVNAMGLKMNYESFVYLITEHLGVHISVDGSTVSIMPKEIRTSFTYNTILDKDGAFISKITFSLS